MWTDDKYVAPLAISVDSEATVHVIWTQNYPQDTGGFGIDLFYASKPLDQPWSTPTLLCVEESFPPQASLAVDTADTLHLVYGLTGCFQWQEEYQYLYKPKAGTWCQPELIGGTQQSGCMSSLTLTCSTQANLLLAYCRDAKIHSAQKPAGSPWSSPTPIAQAEGFCSPQSLADSEDTALLAFQDVDNARIACSSLQPDHSWSAIQYLSGFDHRSGNVQLGKNPSGKVYAVWVRTPNPEDAAGDSLVLRWKTSDNSWSPEQLVYTAVVGSISQYSFVVDSTDTLHFNIRERETISDPYDPFIYQGFYLTVPFAQVIT
jgi:hypothetical protein